jgi:hypothetical protein
MKYGLVFRYRNLLWKLVGTVFVSTDPILSEELSIPTFPLPPGRDRKWSFSGIGKGQFSFPILRKKPRDSVKLRNEVRMQLRIYKVEEAVVPRTLRNISV